MAQFCRNHPLPDSCGAFRGGSADTVRAGAAPAWAGSDGSEEREAAEDSTGDDRGTAKIVPNAKHKITFFRP